MLSEQRSWQRCSGPKVFPFPKPRDLIRTVIQQMTAGDDIVMDSFAGSGTTGHAVLAQNNADGGNRRFITVEMDETICREVTTQRIRKAIEGYGETPGLGSGFRFCKLGAGLFDEAGNIAGEVKFPDLAAHVFFTETGVPIPKRAKADCPLLGVHDGKAVYLLFNGVLGDNRPAGGNVLTHSVAQDCSRIRPRVHRRKVVRAWCSAKPAGWGRSPWSNTASRFGKFPLN